MSRHKRGAQLNGYEMIKSPIVGSDECYCCTCCNNTRPEYYVMTNGTTWAVSTDGTIGVLREGEQEFEVKYHARNYHSWRLSANVLSLNWPVRTVPEDRIGQNGDTRFPFWRDLIGFQTDVDECVIYNRNGDLLYEGRYDGRQFGLFYNGENNEIRETTQKFHYDVVPVYLGLQNPTIRDNWFSNESRRRWGNVNRLRFHGEGPDHDCDDPEGEDTRLMYEEVPTAFTAIGWQTLGVYPGMGASLFGTRCAYVSATDYNRQIAYKDYKCERDKCEPEAMSGRITPGDYGKLVGGMASGNLDLLPDAPVPGGSAAGVNVTVLPRSRVLEKICRPPNDSGMEMQEQFDCEEEEGCVRYKTCFTEFLPDTPLRHQIQGFNLNVCGNFIRVIYRNSKVAGNKFYRFIGNVTNKSHLPKRFPTNLDFDDPTEMEEYFEKEGINVSEQDGWGFPLWWRRYLPLFYVYGAHPETKFQWALFSDQEARDIESVKWLNVPGSLADDKRKQDLIDCEERVAEMETPPPRDPCARFRDELCAPVSGAVWHIPVASRGSGYDYIMGTFPQKDGWESWDPYKASSYGVQWMDVMSVGSASDRVPDSQRLWYWFDGIDWVQGEGTMQDLKDYAKEDLNFIFFKGERSLNQCDTSKSIIAASDNHIKCCSDYLIIGHQTTHLTRQVYRRSERIYSGGLEREPTDSQMAKETFACCDSFFGFSLLDTTRQAMAHWYNLRYDSEGYVVGHDRVTGTPLDDTFSTETSTISVGRYVNPDTCETEEVELDGNVPQFGGCDNNCRYYFIRQNDKQGILMYRGMRRRTFRGREARPTDYEPWRFIYQLDIKNATNFAPPSGCLSVDFQAFLPCEGTCDTGGTQSFVNGAKEIDVHSCTPRQPSYITCNDPNTINVGPCTCENCEGETSGSLTIQRCDTYTNVGSTQRFACDKEPTFRLTGQGYRITSGENTHGCQDGNGVFGAGASFISAFRPRGGGTMSVGSVAQWSLLDDEWLDIHYTVVDCDGSLTAYRNDTGEAVATASDTCSPSSDWCDMFTRVNCGNSSDGSGSGDAGSGDDEDNCTSLDVCSWGIARPENCSTTSSCTGCSGTVNLSFSLWGREIITMGTYWCDNRTMRYARGTAGSSCSQCVRYTHCSPNGYGGAIACQCRWNENCRRLNGTQVVFNPYTESFVTLDYGVAGTQGSTSGGFANDPCPNTIDGPIASVCINGKGYSAIWADEYCNNSAVLVHGPYINPRDSLNIVFETLTYSGTVLGCAYTQGALYPHTAPGALNCWYKYNIGCMGPDCLACGQGGPGIEDDDDCGGAASCGHGSVRRQSGALIVDLTWKGRLYRFTAGSAPGKAPLGLQCCGPYTLLTIYSEPGPDGTGGGQFVSRTLRYYDSVKGSYGENWNFGGCCGNVGEGAVLRDSVSGAQELWIEGNQMSIGDVLKGDPANPSVLSRDYPLSLQCCGSTRRDDNDVWYLVYHHSGNEVEWYREYTPRVRSYSVQSAAYGTMLEGRPGVIIPPLKNVGEAVAKWKEEEMPFCKMILLDGTECECIEAGYIVSGEGKVSDTYRIGPRTWRTTTKWGGPDIKRTAVWDKDALDRDVLKHPAVDEFEFNDPLAPWWGSGEGGGTKNDGVVTSGCKGGGTTSLFKTLLGAADVALGNEPMTLEQRIEMTKKKIQSIERRIAIIGEARVENGQVVGGTGQILVNWMLCLGYSSDWYYRYLAQGFCDNVRYLMQEREQQLERIELEKAFLLQLQSGQDLPPTTDVENEGVQGKWPFGFVVKPGRNVAAAYFRTNFLVNDSRMKGVKCYCDFKIGVFSWIGTGYFWWDEPILDRQHIWSEEFDYNALGNPEYRIWKSYFGLFQGLPNTQKYMSLNTERPPGVCDAGRNSEWLIKYPPEGNYVFHAPGELWSKSLDKELKQVIEPIMTWQTVSSWLSTWNMMYAPKYSQGYYDNQLAASGVNHEDVLWTADRHAPVRYDRGLSWEQPYQLNGDHSHFGRHDSSDFNRTPFTEGGDRVVTGSNGVLHVFDRNLGRMDFNAETLASIDIDTNS